jgi:hypothetical protein
MNKTNPTTNEETGSQLANGTKRNTIDQQDTRTQDLHHCTCQPDANPQTTDTASSDQTTTANSTLERTPNSLERLHGEKLAEPGDLVQVVVVPVDIFGVEVVAEDEDSFVLFGGAVWLTGGKVSPKTYRYTYFQVGDEYLILRFDNIPFTLWVRETKRFSFFIDSVTWAMERTDNSVVIEQAPMSPYREAKWKCWHNVAEVLDNDDVPW